MSGETTADHKIVRGVSSKEKLQIVKVNAQKLFLFRSLPGSSDGEMTSARRSVHVTPTFSESWWPGWAHTQLRVRLSGCTLDSQKTRMCHNDHGLSSFSAGGRGRATGAEGVTTRKGGLAKRDSSIAGLAINPVRFYWTLRPNHWEFC